MKLNTDQAEAIISNVETQGSFKIKNSAKAFKILSSGLYSNKIKAIVRELSCNAVDSHKEAGKEDVPFEVHMPNTLEPWFSVKDFGIGLDHLGVTELYTTYFESTKQDSNDYIGALGLGSKSPFSYTDNFTVTAIKDGIQRIYTAYIDDTGCPSIALMGESKTDAGNGVEVKLSINDTYDFGRFSREAILVFKWFKLHPIIVGTESFEFEDPEYIEKDIIPGVHLAKYGDGPIAIQGNIAYPLAEPDAENIKHLSSLFKCKLVIEFNIGDLDIAASREELSYIPWTVKNIIKRFEEIGKGADAYVVAQLDDIKCEWEKAYKIKQLYSEAFFRQAVRNYCDPNGKNGSDIYKGLDGSYVQASPTLEVFPAYLEKIGLKFRLLDVEKNWSGTVTRQITQHKKWIQSTDTYSQFYQIPVNPNLKIVLNDGKRGSLARIQSHFKHAATESTTILSLEPIDLKMPERERNKLYKKFLKKYFNPPHEQLLVSELRSKTTIKEITTSLMRVENVQVGNSYYGHKMRKWRHVQNKFESDPNKIYYYVPLSNRTTLNRDGTSNHDFLSMDMMRIKRSNIMKGETIYGVRKNHMDAIKDEKNWVLLYDAIEDAIAKYDQTKLLESYMMTLVDDNLMCGQIYDAVKTLDSTSLFKIVVDKLSAITLSKSDETSDDINKLLEKYNITNTWKEEADKFEILYKSLYDVYSMLNFVDGGYIINEEKDATRIIEYIKLIDTTRSNTND